MADDDAPDVSPELVEDPEIKSMLRDFVLEAGKEAIDSLRHGNTQTKTALIKMVLTEAFKARTAAGSQDAERALAETRALIIESVLGPQDDDGGDDEA